jgi:hypothetical protein
MADLTPEVDALLVEIKAERLLKTKDRKYIQHWLDSQLNSDFREKVRAELNRQIKAKKC